MSQYLGDISAYALAVSQGYTGTEEEYAELMASYATVGQTAVTAAQTATTKASEAATSATTATNKATEATTAATTATTKAGEASTSASTATSAKDTAVSASQTATTKATEATTAAATATSAKTDAVAANTAAQSAKTAAQTAQTGAETAAASVQSSAAQIATNAEDISELKEELTVAVGLNFATVANTFINKNTGLPGTSPSYIATDYIPVVGAVWLYTYTGNDNAGYAFYDANKVPVSYGATYPIRRTWTKLDVPSGARFFRATCGVNQASEFGIKLQIADEVTYALNRLPELDVLNKKQYSFKNNMSTDGIGNLPNCTMYRNGASSADNYGKSGTSYNFNIPVDKFHLYYEFKFTDPVHSAYGSVATKRFITAFASGYFIGTFGGSYCQETEIVQNFTLQVASGASKTISISPNPRYRRLQGDDAFYVQYTNSVGQSSVGTITFSDGSVTVNVDGTSTVINCTADTTIASLVASLNDISGISAVALIQEEKTYGDLLPVVSKSTATETVINLLYSGTKYDGTTFVDAVKNYVPLALNDEWHSVEMIYDPNGDVSCAFDGVTVTIQHGTTTPNQYLIVNQNNMPIVIRNMILDYGSAGDAEVVDYVITEDVEPKKQLISSHNSKLLIFEGHGMQVGTDAGIPQTEPMDCSTERLRLLFATAKRMGYVPVTLSDVIKWKKGHGTLPKRCFTMIFDDWRFPNYVDYDKRKPFMEYDVKPGLAVVTNEHPLDESYEINGASYKVSDMVEMTMKAGWYAHSHTYNHSRMTAYTPTECGSLFKTSVLDANLYGIHADVLTYPYGAISQAYLPVLKHSGFSIGVGVVENYYNCIGSNDFYLTRVEVGQRRTLEMVLATLN